MRRGGVRGGLGFRVEDFGFGGLLGFRGLRIFRGAQECDVLFWWAGLGELLRAFGLRNAGRFEVWCASPVKPSAAAARNPKP